MKLLTLSLCLSLSLCFVRCDEHPSALSVGADLKKLSAAESQVTESVSESKSKDGDTLDASPSLQNPQSDYSYVVSNSKPVQPLSIDLGPYSSGQLAPEKQYGDSQSGAKPQSVIYRYTTNSDGSVGPSADGQQQQQQSYIRSEPQHPIYEQKTYVRQAQMEEVPKPAQASSAGYRLPELPRTAPGVSTTFSSPEVKIVSHTRSFLPVVYNKPVEESSADQQSEQEYDKAVQDRPGGSYAQEQPDDGYEQVDQNEEQRGPSGQSYDSQNSYRQNEDRVPSGVGEVLSRGPYYNIHKPIAAHVQVIEDKDEYKTEEKERDNFERQPSYGLRTQPRPQFKNYKPSGYKPGMLSAYDPPSPPMSAFLSPVPGQQNNQNNQADSEADDEESYNNRDLNVRPQRIPEPQAMQQQHRQQSQGPPGVEIEFDQANKNDPQVIRGPGGYQRPESYGPGPELSNNGQDYNQDRPNDIHQDYENNNHLGPKYNVEGDEPAPNGRQNNFQRGRPQQVIKPQEIEYGFIPLSEAKEILGPFRGPNEEQRPPNRPHRPQQRPSGFGPVGYREQRGPHGMDGPHRRPPQFNEEGMTVSMYGRGQQGDGHPPQRPQMPPRPQFNSNDYREQPMGPMGGPYRKPQFERPQFPKNSGQENNGFNFAPQQDNTNNEDVEEVLDDEEGDYGVPLKGRGPHSHSHSGNGLPPGASYNPRDVGLDEAVVAQLNLAASAPAGIAPGGIPSPISPAGFRGSLAVHGPGLDIPFSGSRPFPGVAAAGVPKPRPVPYSASGQGFRSQYGYRAAAASEVSPQTAVAGSPIAQLLNMNPVKSFRSLMSYITGGING